MDPLVLDTNALADRSFREALATYTGLKRVPAVAYTELAVLALARKGAIEPLDRILREVGIEVERFQWDEARTAAWTGVEAGDFSENARDHLIGAHAASPPRILVSRNVDDFGFLGDRVLTPREAREAFAF